MNEEKAKIIAENAIGYMFENGDSVIDVVSYLELSQDEILELLSDELYIQEVNKLFED